MKSVFNYIFSPIRMRLTKGSFVVTLARKYSFTLSKLTLCGFSSSLLGKHSLLSLAASAAFFWLHKPKNS